jgi:hypothetical protein
MRAGWLGPKTAVKHKQGEATMVRLEISAGFGFGDLERKKIEG